MTAFDCNYSQIESFCANLVGFVKDLCAFDWKMNCFKLKFMVLWAILWKTWFLSSIQRGGFEIGSCPERGAKGPQGFQFKMRFPLQKPKKG
jgi:hypothetical protein